MFISIERLLKSRLFSFLHTFSNQITMANKVLIPFHSVINTNNRQFEQLQNAQNAKFALPF